jgi:hypothetical protein
VTKWQWAPLWTTATSNSSRYDFVLSRDPLALDFAWAEPRVLEPILIFKGRRLHNGEHMLWACGGQCLAMSSQSCVTQDRRVVCLPGHFAVWIGVAPRSHADPTCVTGSEDRPLPLPCTDARRARDVSDPEEAVGAHGHAAAASRLCQGKPVGHKDAVPEQERWARLLGAHTLALPLPQHTVPTSTILTNTPPCPLHIPPPGLLPYKCPNTSRRTDTSQLSPFCIRLHMSIWPPLPNPHVPTAHLTLVPSPPSPTLENTKPH